MTENKTVKKRKSVDQFINETEHKRRKEDAEILLGLMTKISGTKPRMWGDSIIGFGDYHYKYESGREGDSFKIGFSPRKSKTSVYLMDGFDKYEEILKRIGKHKKSKACLYINKMLDVNIDVLEELLTASWEDMTKKYG